MLTDRERDVLECLVAYAASGEKSGCHDEWALPMDIGAWDASHHSGTLRRLAIKDMVQRRPRINGARIHTIDEVKTGRREINGKLHRLLGPYRYRITKAGRAALSPKRTQDDEN